MDKQAKEILEQISKAYQHILNDRLTGIYVHSLLAALAGKKSDIDFLVVTKEPPSLHEKKELIEVLLGLDGVCPPKGLEMSLVVLERHCNPFTYPTPFELHFSDMHKDNCLANPREYCMTMSGVDKDLAAHITVLRDVGITLCGMDIKHVFGPVPIADYIDSIKSDIENAVSEVDRNPVDVTLNLCRVLAYIRDGVVLSKEQGGRWAMERLPAVYRRIIQRARESYCGDGVAWVEIDSDAARRFAEYMLEQIGKGTAAS